MTNQNVLETNEDVNANPAQVTYEELSEKPAPRRKPPTLYLLKETVKEKYPFMGLVRRYFGYLPPNELILNTMLLVGEFDIEKASENIVNVLSTPLDYPLEDSSLVQVRLIEEARRICTKYQYEMYSHIIFRPDINAVGNALICTGHFNVDKVVNEIAGLNKRPKDVSFFYERPKLTM